MAKAGERYIPSLKDVIPYKAEVEVQRIWKAIYGLLDLQVDLVDLTLTMPTRIDRDILAKQPVLVVTRQDTTGGWAIEWATNADGSLKFKGLNLVTPDTTANTYSAYLFIGIKPTEAMLVAYVTGGNLA